MLNRLKDWLRAGGTLDHVGRGDALGDGQQRRSARARQLLLKDGQAGYAAGATGATGAAGGSGGSGGAGGAGAVVQAASKPADFDYDKAIQPDRERPASQPGAILRVTLDTDHWLTRRARRRDAGDDRRQRVSSRRSS